MNVHPFEWRRSDGKPRLLSSFENDEFLDKVQECHDANDEMDSLTILEMFSA